MMRQTRELERLDLALERLDLELEELWRENEQQRQASSTTLEPLLERLHLSRKALPSLSTVGGNEPSVVIKSLQEDCAAKSWILEYDRETSPFFPEERQPNWDSLRQKKEGAIERWAKQAEKRMNESSLCSRLLAKTWGSPNELRRELMDLGPLKEYDRTSFDELYLWELVSKLLAMEEEGVHNPLLEASSLLEGWLGAHLHAPWTDRCFLNIGDVTKVVRSEGQSSTSRSRREKQSTERKKDRPLGAKVDMILAFRKLGIDPVLEVLFHEAKPEQPWTHASVLQDRLKLQKEMNDAFFASSKRIVETNWDKELVVFGIQSVGLLAKVYVLDASLEDVVDFSEVFEFEFPKEVSKNLRNVLMAGCLMITIKEHIVKMNGILAELLKSFRRGDLPPSPSEPSEKDRPSPQSPKHQGPSRKLQPSAPTPPKKGGGKEIKGGRNQCDSLSTTMEEDLVEDRGSPNPRYGQPWYVEFALRCSDGRPVAVKKLRMGWSQEEYLDRELSLHMLANRANVRFVVPLLAMFKPRLGRAHSQFAMVFPRLLPLNDHRILSLSVRGSTDSKTTVPGSTRPSSNRDRPSGREHSQRHARRSDEGRSTY
jgi:hypothetical protein